MLRFLMMLASCAPLGAAAQPLTLDAIPDAPTSVSAELRYGMGLARQALDRRMPRLSPRAESHKLERWRGERLIPWAVSQRAIMQQAESALFALSASGHGASAFATAVIALMFDDFVRALATIPIAADHRRRARRRADAEALARSEIAPVAERARDLYARCAATAPGAALASFCAAHAASLTAEFQLGPPIR